MQFYTFGNVGGAFKFNGVDAITQDPLTVTTSFIRSVADASKTNTSTELAGVTNNVIVDLSTGDQLNLENSTVVHEIEFTGVGNPFAELTSFTEWQLTNNSTKVFAIQKNGAIQTNQLQAASIRLTQTDEIPVYNESGTLKGYIKIFNV